MGNRVGGLMRKVKGDAACSHYWTLTCAFGNYCEGHIGKGTYDKTMNLIKVMNFIIHI